MTLHSNHLYNTGVIRYKSHKTLLEHHAKCYGSVAGNSTRANPVGFTVGMCSWVWLYIEWIGLDVVGA